jgi:putative ABC transport system permease protein
MLRNYFNIAWRNVRRNPVFSLINICGLAIGLTCCMLIILYTKDEVSFDRFHKNADNIYRLTYTFNMVGDQPRRIGSTNLTAAEGFQREIPGIAAVVHLKESSALVRRGNTSFNESIRFTDPNFFSVFTFPLTEGNATAALQNENSVVITRDMAKKYFGAVEAVGQTLEIDYNGEGFQTFMVSAVAEETPQNSSINFTFLLPISHFKKMNQRNAEDWMSGYLNAFLVLEPNTSAQAVQSKFASVFDKHAGAMLKFLSEKHNVKAKIEYGLQPFTGMHLSTDFGADNGLTRNSNPTWSYILSGIALLILLIACINFVNITIAQSLRRAKEIGIRKVTGGRRIQLLMQFLTESLLVSSLAFALALLITYLLLPTFNDLANKKLSLAYLADGYLVGGYLILLVITAAIAGIYPGWILSGFNPIASLYSRLKLTGRNYFTRSLVVFQFALSTLLIIATLTIYLQVNFLLNKDLGYDDENMVRISMTHGGNQKLPLFKNELKKYDNILEVTGCTGGNNIKLASVNGKDFALYDTRIDDQYLTAFKIRLLKGRNFSSQNPADTSSSVIVNETFAKEAGMSDPVGKEFSYKGSPEKKYTIIGMVKDFHFLSLREKMQPLMLHQLADRTYNQIWVKIKPGQIPATMQLLEATYKKFEPLYRYSYQFMNELNAKQYEGETRWKNIISFSACIVVFVSCIGLFGLSALSIRQRTKEIGVRKVLGAPVRSIISLLSMTFCKLVLVSVIIAFPVGWWAMNKWLQDFAYRIDMGWWIFAAAGVVALSIAFLTISFQAAKAALANPVKSLRTE